MANGTASLGSNGQSTTIRAQSSAPSIEQPQTQTSSSRQLLPFNLGFGSSKRSRVASTASITPTSINTTASTTTSPAEQSNPDTPTPRTRRTTTDVSSLRSRPSIAQLRAVTSYTPSEKAAVVAPKLTTSFSEQPHITAQKRGGGGAGGSLSGVGDNRENVDEGDSAEKDHHPGLLSPPLQQPTTADSHSASVSSSSRSRGESSSTSAELKNDCRPPPTSLEQPSHKSDPPRASSSPAEKHLIYHLLRHDHHHSHKSRASGVNGRGKSRLEGPEEFTEEIRLVDRRPSQQQDSPAACQRVSQSSQSQSTRSSSSRSPASPSSSSLPLAAAVDNTKMKMEVDDKEGDRDTSKRATDAVTGGAAASVAVASGSGSGGEGQGRSSAEAVASAPLGQQATVAQQQDSQQTAEASTIKTTSKASTVEKHLRQSQATTTTVSESTQMKGAVSPPSGSASVSDAQHLAAPQGSSSEAASQPSTSTQSADVEQDKDKKKNDGGGGDSHVGGSGGGGATGTLRKLGAWALMAYYGTDSTPISSSCGEDANATATNNDNPNSGSRSVEDGKFKKAEEAATQEDDGGARAMDVDEGASRTAVAAGDPVTDQTATAASRTVPLPAIATQSGDVAQSLSMTTAKPVDTAQTSDTGTYNYWWATISRGSKPPPPPSRPTAAEAVQPVADAPPASEATPTAVHNVDNEAPAPPPSGWTSYVSSWIPSAGSSQDRSSAFPDSTAQLSNNLASPDPPSSSNSVAGSAPSTSALNAAGWLLSQAQGIRRPSQASARSSIDDNRSEGKRPRTSGELEEASGDLLKSARAIKRAAQGLSPSATAAVSSSSGKSFVMPATPPLPRSAPRRNLVVPSFDYTFKRPPRSDFAANQTAVPDTAPPRTQTGWTTFGFLSANKPAVEPNAPKGNKAESSNGLPRLVSEGPDAWKNVKRVVIVGVHGWYPNAHIQKLTGAPRTSAYFASMMGQAVLAQFEADHGVAEESLAKVTYIPLDGEGTVNDRVDRLFKLYLSRPEWVADMRRADAVFVAAHSQGCIVASHLIARLISQGHIRTPLNSEAVARCEYAFGPIILPSHARPELTENTGLGVVQPQKVCFLAMCGVSHGPFSASSAVQPYLWFENAAARELFEFQDTSSTVSIEYHRSLSAVVENGVKVILLASLDDQLVPIYSALFASASHPLLIRLLYVDSSIHASTDFLTNLLVLCLMLRNAGINDQGLIGHLSDATAGAWIGAGHTTPYEDPGAYTFAVRYTLQTGASRRETLQVEPFSARDARNDYELPWTLRGILDDPKIQSLFSDEIRQLREGVLDWQPTTKALIQIKKRLEPMAGAAAIQAHRAKAKQGKLGRSPSSVSVASSSQPATGGESKYF